MFVCYCAVAPYNVTITSGNNTVSPVIVEYGDSLTLNCSNSGGPNNVLRWIKDGLFEGITDNLLMINAATTDDGGIYQCVVSNTAGESSTNITIYGMCVTYLSIYYMYYNIIV